MLVALRFLVVLILAACACTAASPPPIAQQVTMPGRPYGSLWGATGVETCAALAEVSCSGSHACEVSYESVCTLHSQALIVAPTRELWEANWATCLGEIAADEFGFECSEFVP